jgi:hypothetical protein
MEALRTEPVFEGEMPASSVQVASKVLSQNSSNLFLKNVGFQTPPSSKSVSSNEVKLGSNLQLKRQQLFKVNWMTSGRKFNMQRKTGQGHRRSWRSTRSLQRRTSRRWRDQFAPQEALLPPGKCFVIDFNVAAAQLSFLLFVTFPI